MTDQPADLAALIDGLSRAYDIVKPEPGMGGPHDKHLGGVSASRAAIAIDKALEYLAGVRVTGEAGLRRDIERLCVAWLTAVPVDILRAALASPSAPARKPYTDGSPNAPWNPASPSSGGVAPQALDAERQRLRYVLAVSLAQCGIVEDDPQDQYALDYHTTDRLIAELFVRGYELAALALPVAGQDEPK